MTTQPVSPRSRKDRDAGLLRVKNLTRWSLAGALAGTGLFAGLATHTTVASTGTASTNSQSVQQSSSATSDDDSTATSSAPTTTTPTTVTTSNGPPTMTSGAS